jgi:tellurite resistance protein TerC
MWVAFTGFVLALLALDLGVFHRRPHAVTLKEAAIWSGIWVSLALGFNLWLYLHGGSGPAMEFLTGYLIEKSLAVDNIFVFAMIFTYFAVPAMFQHRILFWGILSALVMRGVLIFAGAYLIDAFHWVLYLFGAFLIVTGIRMTRREEKAVDFNESFVVRMIRRVIPVSGMYHGANFLVRQKGVWIATPLLVVLVLIEISDVIFAVDSIPAIFAVTQDPFIVWTSNVFAILGLRSMYFLLAGIIPKFHLLKPALAVIMVFVGTKMLLLDVYKIPTLVSLSVVALVLLTAVIASILIARNRPESDPQLAIANPEEHRL